MGYSGIGYKTADVRAVPFDEDGGGACHLADEPNAYTGEYPLARFLCSTSTASRARPLDPLRREFLEYVLRKEGQETVVKDGYIR